MDARRLLTPTCALLVLMAAAPSQPQAAGPGQAMSPIANPPDNPGSGKPTDARRTSSVRAPAPGAAAIAAANLQARERSRADRFVGGAQVFAYQPGRIYEVWTAPLRVTTLTLGPGESVAALSAGDTVRWLIGETASGEGPARRVHVLVKPLEQRLETNLVLATSQRLYSLHLRSGPAEGFNAVVAWDTGGLAPVAPAAVEPAAALTPAPAPRLDLAYRIAPPRRRPGWTPVAVMTDGTRTYIAFPPTLAASEAPALFALSADGQAQMVNYRQQGDLFVVDRVLDAAELRLGEPRPQIVRITRVSGDRP